MSQYESIEDMNVDRQLLFFHVLKDRRSSINVSFLTKSCNQSLVSNTVWLKPLRTQFLKKFRRIKLVLILQVHSKKGIVVTDVQWDFYIRISKCRFKIEVESDSFSHSSSRMESYSTFPSSSTLLGQVSSGYQAIPPELILHNTG